MNSTFCIRPWLSLEISNAGTGKMCCWTHKHISLRGAAMSLRDRSLDQIWNSRHMREIRRAMVAGKMVADCQYCYQEEALLGSSPRTRSNEEWGEPILGSEGSSLEAVAAAAAGTDYRANDRPRVLQLDLGNTCNLSCRMCSSSASSKIANDPVHSKWAPVRDHRSRWAKIGGLIERTGRRVPAGKTWHQVDDILHGEVLGDPLEVTYLHIIGGEPLLIKGVEKMIDYVLEKGGRDRVGLGFNTNATILRPALLDKLARFPTLNLFLSVDGTGSTYDYIRYPASWEAVASNVVKLREHLPGANIKMTPVIQACNALTITHLYRFCDELGLDCDPTKLTGPKHLDLVVLPSNARDLARLRLREYAASSAHPYNRDSALSIIERFDAIDDEVDLRHLRRFMQFTNDLDRTRGQSFSESLPELFACLQRAGHDWIDEGRHTDDSVESGQ